MPWASTPIQYLPPCLRLHAPAQKWSWFFPGNQTHPYFIVQLNSVIHCIQRYYTATSWISMMQGMSDAEMLLSSHQGEQEQRIFRTSQEDIQRLRDFIWILMCIRKLCWQSVLWADVSLLSWYVEPRKLCDHVSTEPSSVGKPWWEARGVTSRLAPCYHYRLFFLQLKGQVPGSPIPHRAAARAISNLQISFFFQALCDHTLLAYKKEKHTLNPHSCVYSDRSASLHTIRD